MTLTTTRPAPYTFTVARKAMIDSQLRPSGVNDAQVLARMSTVAREEFVPEATRGAAYMDRAVPLGNGAFLAAPVFHGLMLENAALASSDEVLIVDGGSGYLPELVRPMVARITVRSAQEAAEKSGRARFTAILVDGAIEQVPASLVKQLDENGRILSGIVTNGVTRLASGRRIGNDVAMLPILEMGIPHLSEFDIPVKWSF